MIELQYTYTTSASNIEMAYEPLYNKQRRKMKMKMQEGLKFELG